MENLKIAVVHHSHFCDGCESALVDFLKDRVKTLYFLHHPFSGHQTISSILLTYENGRLISERKSWPVKLPGPCQYLKDFFYTIFYGLFFMKKLDLLIGADNLNALAGWVLKKLGRTKKVVFYTIDYVPVRFSNKILNRIYHLSDRFCLARCDRTWDLTERMRTARKNFPGAEKQMIVPTGAYFEKSPYYDWPQIEKKTLVYLGGLTANNGLEAALRAVVRLKNKFPEIKLKIIGQGPEEKNLKKLTEELGLPAQVEFLGYISEREKMLEIVARSQAALALYRPEPAGPKHFSWYGGAGKVIDYLACGVPVIITDVPCVAGEVKQAGAGLIVDYSVESVAAGIEKLFLSEADSKRFKENARRFGQNRSWENIFTRALSEII